MSDPASDFERTHFEHGGARRLVLRAGHGPGVLVMTEIPGVTPEVLELAREIAAAGFAVAIPDLFGQLGRPKSPGYMISSVARACISREFTLLSTRRRSPITEWLRALARALHDELGGPGIGAIGMCITGNFALSLILDDALRAPVLSQPSLPVAIGKAKARSLHLAAGELDTVRERVRERGLSVLGLRFTADPLCPRARFDRLRDELGSAFEAIEIDSRRGNPDGIPASAHSVLTTDFGGPTRAARDRVLAFLRENLR